LTETEALVLCAQAGVVVEEHRVFASDRHGGSVVDFDKLKQNAPGDFQRFCFELASCFSGTGVEYVLGPAEGGNFIAQSVAGYLSATASGLTTRVGYVRTEKDDFLVPFVDDQYLEDLNGARVLVVDDVLNHGTTIRNLLRWLKSNGIRIHVVGAGVFWNRSSTITPKDLRVPIIHHVIRRHIRDWSKDECPLCKQGIPTVNSRPPASRHWV
jgi:orotate phosphoribosyltransferase